ncbi:hypothetical protein M5X00_26475 [Paenibacillus alvei]|uniref:hypothetical protein n=1 Tax=Paenibacillus alvei TaxID=44250 RepID=UPI00227F7A6F|nr:hypothetical protein [Paenibacillus alvei]MCY9757779.1 hypothetical protein [Paenibacillus alvei]
MAKNRSNWVKIYKKQPKTTDFLFVFGNYTPNYINMSKNRKISSLEFDYLANMKPYIPETDKDSYKALKYTMLNSIEAVFGDKWFNLKEATRQAIDYICFLSIERGFVYASPDHIATRFGIGKSTVYEALKLLREEDILFKANRCSRKQNGLGCAVHFFTIHPYFAHINGYLNLDWKAKEKADWKANIPEIPCETSVPSDLETPTLSLPSYDLKEKDLHTNVPSSSSNTSIVKYVPKEINELYAKLFDFRLRFIWVKITQAWKTIKNDTLDREFQIEIGTKIIKRIYQIWKEKTHNNSDMTIDEMCAFAYKATRDMVYGILADEHLEVYDAEEVAIMGEAVRTIPKYEEICLNVYPEYDYESVKDYVSASLEWGFSMMSPEAMNRILDNYDRYTTIPIASRLALCS